MQREMISKNDCRGLPQQTSTTNYVISALKQKQFFKLVCGASFTDAKIIEDLSFIFTLGGAHVIDLAPSADVIFAARRGIEKAHQFTSSSFPRFTGSPVHQFTPMLMASIQLDKDPHFRKIEVNYNLCDVCGACVKVCPTEAFRIEPAKFIYSMERCYGCGICPSYCHVNALKLVETKPTPKDTLEEMIKLGVRAIEFHFGENYRKIAKIWDEIKTLVSNLDLLSFSIGSNLLSNEEIKKAANLCYKLASKNIILQCDGVPMSGGLKNGNNKDNLSIEVAKIIEEEKLPVFLQISGGTNENSYKKAFQAGVNINGVAIGSYARKILMPYLNNLEDKENLEKAIEIAKGMVDSVKSKKEEITH